LGDLTPNISRYEVACQCGCGFDVYDVELSRAVQQSADFFKKRDGAEKVMIDVFSGNRCFSHNMAIPNASRDSQHVKGKAIDYMVSTYKDGKWTLITTSELSEYLDGKYPDKYGIGKYWSGRVHLDVRDYRARWSSQ